MSHNSSENFSFNGVYDIDIDNKWVVVEVPQNNKDSASLLHLLTHLRPDLRHFSLFRHNPHCSTRLCTMARYKCIDWLISAGNERDRLGCPCNSQIPSKFVLNCWSAHSSRLCLQHWRHLSPSLRTPLNPASHNSVWRTVKWLCIAAKHYLTYSHIASVINKSLENRTDISLHCDWGDGLFLVQTVF